MLPNHYLVAARSKHPVPSEVQESILAYGKRSKKGGEEVLTSLAGRGDLDPTVEAELGKTTSARVFRAWITRPGRSAEEKKTILEKEERSSILSAVAKDESTPADLLELLSGRLTRSVASALCHNPRTPKALLKEAMLHLEATQHESEQVELPQHVQKRVRKETSLHGEVAKESGGELAFLVMASEHLSEAERREAIKKHLHPALHAKEPKRNGRAHTAEADMKRYRKHRHEEARTYQTVEELVQGGNLELETAKELLAEMQRAAGAAGDAYRLRLREQELKAYIEVNDVERRDGAVERARTCTGPSLKSVLHQLENPGPVRTEHERELRKSVAEALLANPAFTPDLLKKHVTHLRRAGAEEAIGARFAQGKKGDLGVLVELLETCAVGEEAAVAYARKSAQRAKELTDALLTPHTTRRMHWSQGREALAALIREGLVPREIVLELGTKQLEALLLAPGGEDLYAETLLEGLGSEKAHWEIFEETSKHETTLKDRIWAASNL